MKSIRCLFGFHKGHMRANHETDEVGGTGSHFYCTRCDSVVGAHEVPDSIELEDYANAGLEDGEIK
jgi:RecJ-like exonuclease